MKTVLFIPGGMEGFRDRDYESVLHAIDSKDYKTVFVPISWKRTTIDN